MNRTQAEDLYCAYHDDNEGNTILVVCEIREDGVRFGRLCVTPYLLPRPVRLLLANGRLPRSSSAHLTPHCMPTVECSINVGSGGNHTTLRVVWQDKMWWDARWRRCRCSAVWPTGGGVKNMDATSWAEGMLRFK